jgi:excisionase family DNA binding protein
MLHNIVASGIGVPGVRNLHRVQNIGVEADAERLLTIHEAAAIMRCHDVTIRRMNGRDGFPPLRKFGKKTRIRWRELKAYLDSRGVLPNRLVKE